MKTISILAILLSFAAYGVPSPAKTLDLAKAETKVEFLAVGRPSMLKIRGKTKDGEAKPLSGTINVNGDTCSGSAEFTLDSLETGISMRDRHMKEKYLETAKFPKAVFKLTELNLPAPLAAGDGEAKKVPFKGTLTVHGVEQPVTGVVDIERKGEKAEFNFDFQTKIPNHKIELPSFMGVTVAEDVQITVEVEGPLS